MIPGRALIQLMAGSKAPLVVTPMIDAAGQIGGASIDLRLGPDIIVARRATGATAFDAADPVRFRQAVRQRQQYVRRAIGDPFHLQPGEFVIARSLEYLVLPDDVSAEALGRSSLGRLGLVIATATMVHPGFKGTITLELTNLGNTPLVLEVGLRIAQLVFRRDAQVLTKPANAEAGGEAAGQKAWGDGTDDESEVEAERRSRAERWWELRPEKPSRYAGQLKPQLSRLDSEEDLRWIAPMAVRYVVGIVGERYSGKSTVLNFLAARRQFRLYRLSQFVYEQAQRLGVDASQKSVLRQVGADLRNEHGDDVLARLAFHRIRSDLLDPDRAEPPQPIVVAGFRTIEELATWQRLSLFRTMVVTADPLKRLKRARRVGFHDAADIQEPTPTGDDEEEWLGWFERNVDAPVGRELLDEAEKAHDPPLQIVNDHDSVKGLHEDLKLQIRRLERWWRALII